MKKSVQTDKKKIGLSTDDKLRLLVRIIFEQMIADKKKGNLKILTMN